MELSYNGNVLPSEITLQLVEYAQQQMNVPPSYLITKLHYEGLWGYSEVAQQNNNWGGMTWVGTWPNPHTRDSGVIVSRGTARPTNEGGYYIAYESTNDFLKDWTYLIRRGGIYNVADSETFAEAVRGMFIYGGAQYDYATMNVTGSKLRYELYLEDMKARRNAINSANSLALDLLDSEPPVTEPDYPDEIETIVARLKKDIADLRKKFNEIEQNVTNVYSDTISTVVYDYGNSQYKGNEQVKITKMYDNVYKIEPTIKTKTDVSDVINDGQDELDEIEKEIDDLTKPIEPSNPSTNNVPHFPTREDAVITSVYGWRVNPVRDEWIFHSGTDFASLGGAPWDIYAVMDGVVVNNYFHTWNGQAGTGYGWIVQIEHTGDNYFSQYGHLAVQSPIPVGTSVTKGQIIGTMGTTGSSTGVHLDLEISPNGNFWTEANTVDPQKYLNMTL